MEAQNQLDFIAIDFETASGTLPWAACAMGIVDVRGGQIAAEYATLINPNCEFDYRCVRVHGIKEEDVQSAMDLHAAMNLLRKKLEGRVVVAHNAGFDIGVMKAAMEREGIEPPHIKTLCTVILARRAIPGRSSYSLPKMMDVIGEYDAHDALSDARSCAKLLLISAQACHARTVQELLARLEVEPGQFNAEIYTQCKVIPGRGRRLRKPTRRLVNSGVEIPMPVLSVKDVERLGKDTRIELLEQELQDQQRRLNDAMLELEALKQLYVEPTEPMYYANERTGRLRPDQVIDGLSQETVTTTANQPQNRWIEIPIATIKEDD